MGRNTLFGVGERVFRMVVKLAMMGFIIDHVGKDGFGLWEILVSVVGFMSLGVGGVGSAFQKYVAEAYETRDFLRASRRLSNGAAMMLVLALVMLVPLAIFPEWVAAVMRVSPQFQSTFLSAVVLLAATMVWTNFGTVYGSIVMGVHRIDLTRAVDLVCTLLEACLNVVLLLSGYGVLGLVISYAVMEIARTALYYTLARRIIPAIIVSPRMLSKSELRETMRFAGGYQVFNYLQVGYNSLLPIVIQRAFGEEVTGVYGICRRLIGFPALISEAVLLPLLSGATLVYARREMERFRRLFFRVVKFTLVALVPGLVFLCVFSSATFTAMAKSPHELAPRSMILLSVATVVGALARVYAAMYRATGGGSRDIMWTAGRMVTFVATWAVVSASMGYFGALLAFVVAELAGWIYMDVAMAHVIGRGSLRKTCIEMGRVLAPAVVVGLVCAPVTWIGLPAGWEARWSAVVQLLLAAMVYGVIGGAGLVVSGFISSDEREWLGMYVPWLRKGSGSTVDG
ncbi:oligosaccharide flippase family protein [bacterium]|nr:oligosaccharide flippase family protein [bacterium]